MIHSDKNKQCRFWFYLRIGILFDLINTWQTKVVQWTSCFYFLGTFFISLSLLRKMAFDCLHQILALKQKFNFIQTFFILRLFIYCVQDWKNANLKPSRFYLRKKWCKIVTIKPRKRNIMFTPVICRFCCTLHNDRTKIT